MSPGAKRDRVTELFEAALREAPPKRGEFLREACGADQDLLKEVGSLIDEFEQIDELESTTLTLEQQAFSPSTGRTIPTRIGRYIVNRELGRGGMGVVFEAEDPLIGRIVAIKIIRLDKLVPGADSTGLRDRLFREARLAGGLSHPGIVTIHDVGVAEGMAFIAMEYVDGRTLEAVMVGERLQPFRSSELLGQAAAALDYAHRNGLVHRDVKPGNIIVPWEGPLKITDFGIAKIITDGRMTMTGKLIGTPNYMSPEHIRGTALDGRSDQFSLAVIAYEMLTGSRPFESQSLAVLLHEIAYGIRPSASASDPTLPTEVDGVLRRALALDPKNRYDSCSQFVDVLNAAVGNGHHPTREPLPPPSRESIPIQSRKRRWLSAAAVLFLLIISYFGWEASRFQSSVRLSVSVQRADSPRVFVVPGPAIPSLVLLDHDRLRLRVSSPKAGFLYVIQEKAVFGEVSGIQCLFPSNRGKDAAYVPAGEPVNVPTSGPFELNGSEPKLQLWIVWSKRAIKQLEFVEEEPRQAQHFLKAAPLAAYQTPQPTDSDVTLTSRGNLLVRLIALDHR
jgi:serine/threonine protein kinase